MTPYDLGFDLARYQFIHDAGLDFMGSREMMGRYAQEECDDLYPSFSREELAEFVIGYADGWDAAWESERNWSN